MNIGILILMIIGGGVRRTVISLYRTLVFRQSLSGRSTGKSAMDISLHISYMNYYFMTVFRSCSISSIFGQDLFLLFVEQQFLIVLIILVAVIFLQELNTVIIRVKLCHERDHLLTVSECIFHELKLRVPAQQVYALSVLPALPLHCQTIPLHVQMLLLHPDVPLS